MKIKPLRDLIVILADDISNVSDGGIHLTSDIRDKPATATVVAVGPGLRDRDDKLVPTGVEVGDEIIFVRDSGTEVKVDGVDYRIITPENLVGIIN